MGYFPGIRRLIIFLVVLFSLMGDTLTGADIIKGDINQDGRVDLADAIFVLQIISGISHTQIVSASFDVNGDAKIGLEEAIFILQIISELRNPGNGQGTLAKNFIKLEGDGALAIVNTSLPLTGQVTDENGKPMASVNVNFEITLGQGSLSSSQVPTNTDGLAATTLTLGKVAGIVKVQATVQGLAPEIFTMTAMADRNNARLIQVSGNKQVGNPGEVLPEPLVVRVEDQFSNPVTGESITAKVIQGSGELISVTQFSQAPQLGQASFLLESSEGSQATGQTNARGEAAFRLLVATSGEVILVEVAALNLPEPKSVRFITLVGFVDPVGIAIERTGDFMVVDKFLRTVIRANAQNGNRTVVSADDIGSGPTFSKPFFIAIEPDGHLLVVDHILGGLIRVDLVNGDRTLLPWPGGYFYPFLAEADGLLVGSYADGVYKWDTANGNLTIVSGQERGNGPLCMGALAIVKQTNGQLVLLINAGYDYALCRIDPVSGDRTIISSASLGNGPPFESPVSIAVEASGHIIVVNSSISDEFRPLLRVDPISGDRTVVSDSRKGTGPFLIRPSGIVIEPDGHLVVVDEDLAALVRIDPVNGNRAIISRVSRGNGQPFGYPRGLAVEANGHLIVTDESFGQPFRVIRIDPVSGNRTIVSDTQTGTGPSLGGLEGIAVETDSYLIVAQGFGRNIVRVDPISGNRTIVSGCSSLDLWLNCISLIGSGPAFMEPGGIAIEQDGHLVVMDRLRSEGRVGAMIGNNMVRVDTYSGDRSIISGPDRGLGPPLFTWGSIAMEANGYLVTVNSINRTVIRVDPFSGNRSLVSAPDRGLGPIFQSLNDIAVEADGHLVAVDGGLAAIIRVDSLSGNRTIISDANTGSGFPFVWPNNIAIEGDGNLVVLDSSIGAVLRVNPISGDRFLLSK